MSAQYEEAEGVTPAMIREYLARTGWSRLSGLVWSHEQHRLRVSFLPDFLHVTIGDISVALHMTEQSVLREINPRMRKGKPSDADIEAHRSRSGSQPWLARDEHGNQRVGWWTKPRWKQDATDPYTFYVQGRGHLSVERVAAWSFWPADRDLNKLPGYPARSGQGEQMGQNEYRPGLPSRKQIDALYALGGFWERQEGVAIMLRYDASLEVARVDDGFGFVLANESHLDTCSYRPADMDWADLDAPAKATP